MTLHTPQKSIFFLNVLHSIFLSWGRPIEFYMCNSDYSHISDNLELLSEDKKQIT